jgi:SAM-dependent methyltransferase
LGLYRSVIFPRLCHWALNRPFVEARRRELLSAAQGDILEIGLGTGLNLPCYPPHVRAITSVDPNPTMHRWARGRMNGMRVDHRVLGSEELPFVNDRFDCVVSTFTLCSIAKVEVALAEVFRVLAPRGQFLFLEHGLSPDAGVQKWQRRLNGLQRMLADNCHLDRDIRQLIQTPTFRSVEFRTDYLPETPKTHGYTFQGRATK